jgi:hypothetical protein
MHKYGKIEKELNMNKTLNSFGSLQRSGNNSRLQDPMLKSFVTKYSNPRRRAMLIKMYLSKMRNRDNFSFY